MTAALADTAPVPFRIPTGINLVRVNAKTGLLAGPGESNVILEAFKEGTEPRAAEPINQGVQDLGIAIGPNGEPVTTTGTSTPLGNGTGGLY